MRKIIYIIMFVLLLFSVSAYDINETINITAEYRDDGILTSSSAYLTIYDPDDDIVLNNQLMNISGTGQFYYEYLTPTIEGEYTAMSRFFVGSEYVGSDEKTFNVGDVNNVKWGVCPTGSTGITFLIVFMIIIVILSVIGTLVNNIGLTLFGAVMLFFFSTITWGCGEIIGIITVVMGVIFLIIAGSMKF